MNINTLIW